VYERGFRALREGAPDAKEEAVMLLEAWRDFEAQCSDFRCVALLFSRVSLIVDVWVLCCVKRHLMVRRRR
jgi:hypothetical protein